MSALSNDLLAWLVPTSVFIAGVVGSPHCVAMCGPLVMAFGRDRKTLVGYQAGRMLTYTSAGAVAGLLGEATFRSPLPVLSVASLLALAVLLATFALRSSAGTQHVAGNLFSRVHGRIWSIAKSWGLPAPVLSFVAGALTVFLPCLHLYGFLAGAAATGTAATGAIFMFTFWASTLPALSAAPLLLKRFFGATSTPVARRWATGLLLAAAVFSLGQFASRIESARAAGSTGETHACHMTTPMHHHH